MKKILVLTGSPRTNGNTDKMADVFEKGAKAAGHKVFRFEAGKKNICGNYFQYDGGAEYLLCPKPAE